MKAKSIIVKSNTEHLIKQLGNELSEYPNIRFFNKKINGEYTIVIKCYNYYNKAKIENEKNFYGNYIYLYTCLSLILSDLIIKNYDRTLVNRILRYNYFYYGENKLKKISNLVNLILSTNSPIESSSNLLLYRKQIILASFLKHFRHTNILYLDGFINFSLNDYNDFLEEIIYNIIDLSVSNFISIDHLNFVIKNMFDY